MQPSNWSSSSCTVHRWFSSSLFQSGEMVNMTAKHFKLLQQRSLWFWQWKCVQKSQLQWSVRRSLCSKETPLPPLSISAGPTTVAHERSWLRGLLCFRWCIQLGNWSQQRAAFHIKPVHNLFSLIIPLRLREIKYYVKLHLSFDIMKTVRPIILLFFLHLILFSTNYFH